MECLGGVNPCPQFAPPPTHTHHHHRTALLADPPHQPPTTRSQLEVERKLRALLTKEKERAEEEAALAMGLCTGGMMFP